jgi:hypothetical protein
MLIVMLVSSIAIAAFTLYLGWHLTPRFCLAAAASCLAPLLINRSGGIRRSMLIPLLTITYVVLHLATKNEGLHNIGLVILPVLITVGSLVLDRLSHILLTVVLNLAVFAMLAIRYFVTRADRFSMNDMATSSSSWSRVRRQRSSEGCWRCASRMASGASATARGVRSPGVS